MLYKHFKGGIYRLICQGFHSETKEPLVVYENVDTREVWVRPRDSFFGLTPDGSERFKPLK